MAAYLVVNATESDLVDINSFGTDVAAMTYRDSVSLSNAEAAALCALKGVAVTKAGSTRQIRRCLGVAATYESGLP